MSYTLTKYTKEEVLQKISEIENSDSIDECIKSIEPSFFLSLLYYRIPLSSKVECRFDDPNILAILNKLESSPSENRQEFFSKLLEIFHNDANIFLSSKSNKEPSFRDDRDHIILDFITAFCQKYYNDVSQDQIKQLFNYPIVDYLMCDYVAISRPIICLLYLDKKESSLDYIEEDLALTICTLFERIQDEHSEYFSDGIFWMSFWEDWGDGINHTAKIEAILRRQIENLQKSSSKDAIEKLQRLQKTYTLINSNLDFSLPTCNSDEFQYKKIGESLAKETDSYTFATKCSSILTLLQMSLGNEHLESFKPIPVNFETPAQRQYIIENIIDHLHALDYDYNALEAIRTIIEENK